MKKLLLLFCLWVMTYGAKAQCVPDTTNLTGYICPGGEGYLFNDTLRTNTGEYQAVYVAGRGCDSVVILSLTMLPGIPPTELYDTICAGWTYLFKDTTLRLPGDYVRTWPSVYGCDSIVNLHLAIRPGIQVSSSVSTCSSRPVLFNDTLRTTSGSYSMYFIAGNGCDSIYTLDLTVLPAKSATVNAAICLGDRYPLGKLHLTAAGTYYDTTNSGICDSITTLHLSVDSNEVSIAQISGDSLLASGQGTIQWMNCTTGQLVAGQTDSIFTTTAFGSFAAVFHYASCTDTTECKTVGYTEVSETGTGLLSVFPNPAHTQLFIAAYHLLPQTMTVYDMNGRKTMEEKYSPQIDISLLPTGVYFIELKHETGSARKRWVKM